MYVTEQVFLLVQSKHSWNFFFLSPFCFGWSWFTAELWGYYSFFSRTLLVLLRFLLLPVQYLVFVKGIRSSGEASVGVTQGSECVSSRGLPLGGEFEVTLKLALFNSALQDIAANPCDTSCRNWTLNLLSICC